LVVEHLPRALRFALRLTGDANTAEDVVQEALCRVLKSWRSYRGDAAFGTWLLQIVVNVDRDRRRRQRPVKPISWGEVIDDSSPPQEHVAVSELRADVRAAIEALPDRQREVALLSLGEGLAARDIALVLETTEANVHTCLHLARKRIAKAIGVNYSRQD
jgi:RNA polymerase sigma-70 factor (ECF subfamily)